jgi:hypothetical protein
MNRLSTQNRAQAIAVLVEGGSINSNGRTTGVAKHTILKLLEDIGCACVSYHHRHVRNPRIRRLQCDEIWTFVGAKAKDVSVEKKQEGWGDSWTWTAIEADTKLCVSYLVGGRDTVWAPDFMLDCDYRIVGHPQISTDAHKPYRKAARKRRLGAVPITPCSTKFTGRLMNLTTATAQNLTMRMSMRRFTRLTNGFSKKIENHGHAVALHFMHYNFVRVHKTLRVTPAMEAGIADHVWSMAELVALLDSRELSNAA